jgi:soluble lytic murein transglycosylase-like protein
MSPPCLRVVAALLVLMLVDPAQADCIEEAAVHHQVNAQVLRAIGWQESRLDPAAVGHNANGSTDIGAFQINSAHLPDLARFGVTARLLADGCVSAYVAAWYYRRQIDRLGNTWGAVGAYHSRTPARATGYAHRIAAILMSWGALPRTALPDAAGIALGRDAPVATTFDLPMR